MRRCSRASPVAAWRRGPSLRGFEPCPFRDDRKRLKAQVDAHQRPVYAVYALRILALHLHRRRHAPTVCLVADRRRAHPASELLCRLLGPHTACAARHRPGTHLHAAGDTEGIPSSVRLAEVGNQTRRPPLWPHHKVAQARSRSRDLPPTALRNPAPPGRCGLSDVVGCALGGAGPRSATHTRWAGPDRVQRPRFAPGWAGGGETPRVNLPAPCEGRGSRQA